MLYTHLIYPIVLFKLVGLMHETNKLLICNIAFISIALWANTMTKVYGKKKTMKWLTCIIIIQILINLNKPYFIFNIPCHDLVPFFLTALWLAISLCIYLFSTLQHRYNFYISNLLSLTVASIIDSLLGEFVLLAKFLMNKVLSIFLRSTKSKLTLIFLAILCLIVMGNIYKWVKQHIHIRSWQGIKQTLQTIKQYIYTLILLLLTPYPSKSLGLASGPIVEYNTTQICEQSGRFKLSNFTLNKQDIQGGLFAQVDLPLFYIRSAILYSRNYTNITNGQKDKGFHNLTIPISLGKTLLSILHCHTGIEVKTLWEINNKNTSGGLHSKKLFGPILGLGCKLGNFLVTLNMKLLIPTEKIIWEYSMYRRFSIQIGYNIFGFQLC